MTTPGATGASPASTGATGASPAPATTTTEAHSQAATPQKIDYGMSPQPRGQTSPKDTELSDEDFYKQYGERIFKHPRVVETLPFKAKYEEAKPLIDFVTKAGGMGMLQDVMKFFGPVYQHLASQEDPTILWGQLQPILQSMISENKLSMNAPAAKTPESSVEDDDPVQAKINAALKEVEMLKTKLTKREEQEQREKAQTQTQRVKEHQTKNLQKYDEEFNKLLTQHQVPPDYIFALGQHLINNIFKYIPTKADGKIPHPLNEFNLESMKECFEKEVLPYYRKLHNAALNKANTKNSEGSPTVPDTTSGRSPIDKRTFSTVQEKAARFAQGITKWASESGSM